MKRNCISVRLASTEWASCVVLALGVTVSTVAFAEVEEVVVTAQKRTEVLQNAPVAMTAIPASELVARGVTDINSAQDLVPSARFQQQSASTEIFIRGVGGSLDTVNIDPTTNFNFNGVYVPREGTSVPLYDLQQIEVLPGPQGTLYGRGAVGGVVNVVFVRPTDKFETRATLETGNYSLAHGTLVQNIPVSSTLFLRGAVDYTHRDGYLESGADSRDDLSGRLSALYQPSTGPSIYLWGYGVSKDGSPANAVNRGLDPQTFQPNANAFLRDNAWDDRFTGPLEALVAPFLGAPKAESQHYESYMAGAQIDQDIGDLTLSVIPSHFYLNWYQSDWLGALPADLNAKYEQTTGEVRLSGDGPKTTWLLGLYGYQMVSSGGFDFAGFTASHVERNRLQGSAAFGELTYKLTDAFRVIAGGRYSVDDRDGRGSAADFTGAPVIPYSFDKTFRNFDWKLGAQYDLTRDSLIYAAVQTGYQPGTFNEIPNSASFDNLVNSAELTAYTVGNKNRFFDDAVQLNLEAFFYDYTNLFQQAFDAGAVNPIFNAEKVEVYGVQLDGWWKVTLDDQFSVAAGYLHARTVDFTTPGGNVFNDVQLAMSPDWTVTAGYHHDFQLQNGYIRASVDARYSASFCADYTHAIGTCQPDYTKSNAFVTYYSADDRWSLGLWIKNIEDEAVIARAGIGGIPGPAVTFLENPRTFGLRATVNL